MLKIVSLPCRDDREDGDGPREADTELGVRHVAMREG